MPRFIRLTRIKDGEEIDIYLNVDRIISFYKRGSDSSYIEIAFPDTVRKYIVKDSVYDICDILRGNIYSAVVPLYGLPDYRGEKIT